MFVVGIRPNASEDEATAASAAKGSLAKLIDCGTACTVGGGFDGAGGNVGARAIGFDKSFDCFVGTL